MQSLHTFLEGSFFGKLVLPLKLGKSGSTSTNELQVIVQILENNLCYPLLCFSLNLNKNYITSFLHGSVYFFAVTLLVRKTSYRLCTTTIIIILNLTNQEKEREKRHRESEIGRWRSERVTGSQIESEAEAQTEKMSDTERDRDCIHIHIYNMFLEEGKST